MISLAGKSVLITGGSRGIGRATALLAARAQRGGDGQDLRQQLRSLFGVMEMNLASDARPFQVGLRRRRSPRRVEMSHGCRLYGPLQAGPCRHAAPRVVPVRLRPERLRQ